MLEVVCGIIKSSSGKVLACRRGLGRHLGGLWEFPGGKMDVGETPQEALARELQEELGVEVEVGERLDAVVNWSDGEVAIRLTGYWCEIVDGEPLALEHEEICWCEVCELDELEWAEADLPLVEELMGG